MIAFLCMSFGTIPWPGVGSATATAADRALE
jgi:hypothetical protein